MLLTRRCIRVACRVLSGLTMVMMTAVGASAQTTGVSTGQGLGGGADDPYWRFIPGAVDYSAPGALTERGTPAAVTSRANMGTWTPRSQTPENDFNNGWIAASDARETDAVHGDNTMRLFVTLTKDKLPLVRFAGTAWGDLCIKHIYVNGRVLAHFGADGVCEQDTQSSTIGQAFSITQLDGLVAGVNVLDFIYYKQDESCDGIRVDFHMIFRETHDRPLLPTKQAP